MAIYYGMVSFMDEQIGRILDALDEQGLTKIRWLFSRPITVIFWGSTVCGSKARFTTKTFCACRSSRVGPVTLRRAPTSEALQSLVDLAPTFLAACDLPIPGAMQG